MNRKHPIISKRLQVLVDECGHDLTRELLLIFLTDYPSWIHRLKDDIVLGDRDRWYYRADQMKSGAANLGAVELAHLFEVLENAPQGTPPDELNHLVQQITDEHQKSGQWVRAFLNEELRGSTRFGT